jgi:hypothetical protein
VSTLNVRDDADGSTLPAGSIARTWKVSEPSGRCGVVYGELQGANATLWTLHSKLEPASEETNLKLGVESLVLPEGPDVIAVRGGKNSATLRTRKLLGSAM